MSEASYCRILEVRIHRVSFADAVAKIDEFVASRRPHQVVTVNMDFLHLARNDQGFHRLINDANLVVADGMPLIWISRWLRQPLPERITGVDLVEQTAALAAERGFRLFLLGAAPGVADAAAALLTARNPGLQIAGTLSPAFGAISDEEDIRIVDQIRAAAPDILLVAFGAPRQEIWIGDHLQKLQVPVCMGVGGSFDLIAGRLPRAPLWMQVRGLEWVYRLTREPRRLWRRYLLGDLPLFLRIAFAGAFRRLGSEEAAPFSTPS